MDEREEARNVYASRESSDDFESDEDFASSRDPKRMKYAQPSDDFESDGDFEIKVVPLHQEKGFHAPALNSQYFKTWEDFEEHFETYCKKTFQIFKIRSSTTVTSTNERQKSFEYPEACGKYFSKTYICTHGWQPRHRGKGERPQQSYRYTGCTARLVLSICRDSVVAGYPKLVVKLHDTKHNHRIVKMGYYMFGDNRSENFDDSIQEVSRLVEGRASFRKIQHYPIPLKIAL